MKEVFETFMDFSNDRRVSALQQPEPDVFNRKVSAVKYKVTIEELTATKEEMEARLSDMYAKTTNYHHRDALREYAKDKGFTLNID